MKLAPRLEAFLLALPHAPDDEFVNATGLGTFRAKYVRRGLEREVVVVHATGAGLALLQPKAHGICRECADAKGRSICEHCQCAMCVWFRQTEERASPQVSREKFQQLRRRLRTFELGGALISTTAPDILGDI